MQPLGIMVVDDLQCLAGLNGVKPIENQCVTIARGDGTNVDRDMGGCVLGCGGVHADALSGWVEMGAVIDGGQGIDG